MLRRTVIAMLLLPAAASGAARAAEPDPAAGRAALLKADADFNAAAAARGAEGWASFFAEDGSMLPSRGGIVTGPAAIREFMAPAFAEPGFSLAWTPERADVAVSGDLGWTTGTWELRRKGPAGDPVRRTGRYVTVWRKQADGAWKVVMDVGNQDPEAEAAGHPAGRRAIDSVPR
jgi:uncharacterized protein (TIGR02246 family)